MTDFVKRANSEYERAIKAFGTYSFFDKGPHEVMDLRQLVSSLRQMEPSLAGLALKELNDLGDGQAVLANYLLVDLQDQPDDWFDSVMEVSGLDL